MHVSIKISTFGMIFLFSTLILLCPAKVIISYGKTNVISDKSSLMKTTDCINSMMTGVFMGSNADCDNSNSNLNSTTNDIHSLINNDLLIDGSQNNNTSNFLAMNHGLSNIGTSPSFNNPSMFTKSLQQDQGLSLGNTSSLHMDSKPKSSYSPDKNDETGNLLDKKNKHGNEIFACFNRAVVSTSYLPDSAIIKCAKDYSSFR